MVQKLKEVFVEACSVSTRPVLTKIEDAECVSTANLSL